MYVDVCPPSQDPRMRHREIAEIIYIKGADSPFPAYQLSSKAHRKRTGLQDIQNMHAVT